MSDKYKSVEELKRAGEPWQQLVRCCRNGTVLYGDRAGEALSTLLETHKSWLTVAAPHGGSIEPHTEGIASALAGADYHLFIFRGDRVSDGNSLHVTSTKFRSSALQRLQLDSDVTLSVHGAHDPADERSFTWLGGRNDVLRKSLVRALKIAGFEAMDAFVDETAPERYSGRSLENFINKSRYHGVQLEISLSQRRALLLGDGKTIDSQHPFIKSLREALTEQGLAQLYRT